MDYLVYLISRGFIAIFRFVPMRLLYGFADFIFFLVYRVAGYRKKVVFTNLRNSFPEKTEKEILDIARGFYHHFSDMLVESLKTFYMSEKEVTKRYRFTNAEVVDEFYREGKDVMCVGCHYGNWEWAGIAGGTQLRHRAIGFYKPLSNTYIDHFIRKTRARGRTRLASITRTPEAFRTDWGEPAVYYMIADQSPSSARYAFWVNFMNQDTAVLHGPEKYARMYNMPVVFGAVKRLKRGYYEATFSVLERDPAKTEPGEISARYMQMVEKVIRENPRYYLWSHRRWKLKRQTAK